MIAYFYYLILLMNIGFSQEIVVESTPIVSDLVPNHVYTIEQSQVSAKGQSTVADILRTVPGLEVVRQGPSGQTTFVFIRGARSEHTLVLVDGVELNDAISPSNGYDFSQLSTHEILRIEVFRGPQSVQFGSGAIGGVVNIVTRSGDHINSWNYHLKTGSFNTLEFGGSFENKIGKLGYVLNLNHNQTHGFSSASKNYGATEPDGAQALSASTRLTWSLSKKTKIDGFIRLTESISDIDRFGGTGGDDPNYVFDWNQLQHGTRISSRLLSDQWETSLAYNQNKSQRENLNLPDDSDANFFKANYQGENRKLDWANRFLLSDYQILTANVQWRKEEGRSFEDFNSTPTFFTDHHQTTLGSSISYKWTSKNWESDFGYRLDHHAKSGESLRNSADEISSYRLGISRIGADQSILRLNYGTGFKIPSLYQLYSLYGRSDLKAEYSKAYHLSFEKKLSRNTVLFELYSHEFADLIDFDSIASQYFNIAEAESIGAEASAILELNPSSHLKLSYSYLDTEDKSTNQSLLRRPRHAIRSSYLYKRRSSEYEAVIRYKGKRSDIDPNTFDRTMAKSYSLVDISYSYKISPSGKFNLQLENIFNTAYEELAGYGTPGLAVFLGVNGEIK